MKTARRKHSAQSAKVADSNITTFSSDLLTPEEERELLTGFWDVKSELVRVLVRHFPEELRAARPPLEPWPMAQFIREHCTEARCHVIAIRRLRDRYVHYKHRLASANIRLAAHVAKRDRKSTRLNSSHG